MTGNWGRQKKGKGRGSAVNELLLMNLNFLWDQGQSSKGQRTGNQEQKKQEGMYHE